MFTILKNLVEGINDNTEKISPNTEPRNKGIDIRKEKVGKLQAQNKIANIWTIRVSQREITENKEEEITIELVQESFPKWRI